MDADWGNSFARAGRHFAQVLTDGGDPIITGQEGRDILAFALAAIQSSAQGAPVALDPAPPPPQTPATD